MRLFLTLTLLCLAPLFSKLTAECHCTPESHCGCLFGYPCTCDNENNSPNFVQPAGCYCTPEDNCGCLNGEPCTCVAEGCFYDFYDDSEYYDYYCDDECDRYVTPSFYPEDESCYWPCYRTGGWMPERCPLFRPFIADPRQLAYSVGWRFNDQALTKDVIDVSYFDSFPFYGWCNAWLCGDKLQIDLDGCLWAVFDPITYSSPLINADYYVGIHVNYAYQHWSTRLRIFHISSHVGDEFLLNHPHFDRRNPSAEYLDYAVSYQWDEGIRLYGLLGWVLEQDHSFCTGRFYAEGGIEARIVSLGKLDTYNKLYTVPFLATHFRYRKDFKLHLDSTYALGIEIGKTNCLCQRLRLYIEYHDGYSVEGQWSCTPTNYLSLRASYGF